MLPRKLGSRLIVVLLASLLITQGLLPFCPTKVSLAAEAPPEVKVENYLIADSRTGRVLASKDAESPHIPASLTKIMTLYILFDEISAGTSASKIWSPCPRKRATGGQDVHPCRQRSSVGRPGRV